MTVTNFFLFMSIFQKILDFFFPPDCLVCEIEGEILCKNCLEKIPDSDPLRYFSTELFQKIFVFGEFENTSLKPIIHQMKYGYAKELGVKIQPFFEKNFPPFFPENPVFIPVPLHFLRQNERGFNQSEILADIFLDIFGNKSEKRSLLKRIRNTPHQAGRSKKERELNVKNAFVLKNESIEKISDNIKNQ